MFNLNDYDLIQNNKINNLQATVNSIGVGGFSFIYEDFTPYVEIADTSTGKSSVLDPTEVIANVTIASYSVLSTMFFLDIDLQIENATGSEMLDLSINLGFPAGPRTNICIPVMYWKTGMVEDSLPCFVTCPSGGPFAKIIDSAGVPITLPNGNIFRIFGSLIYHILDS